MTIRIFRHFVPTLVVLLALCEVGLIFVAWHFYFWFSFVSHTHMYDAALPPFFSLAILAGVVMIVSGLYHTDVFVDWRVMVVQIFITFAIFCPLAVAWFSYFAFTPNTTDSLWGIAQKILLIWLLCILFTRIAFLTVRRI